MKFSESWLREWVNPKLSREQLGERLTMSGLEIEEIMPVEHSSDHVIDVSITPNRGDCLSIRGIAHEISALTQCSLNALKVSEIKAASTDKIPVTISAKKECPYYVGRIIRQVKTDAVTPEWMKERLHRSGLNLIHPVVDVMNYVMLELGQPMHAFDLDKIAENIHVRMAKKDETVHLLNEQKITLDEQTLVIADKKNVLAIAGVMGGMDSGVTATTRDIFLESAFFNAMSVARQCRQYGLTSDSSYRFERGIDPTLQKTAIERATQLLLEIVGGQPGPVIEVLFAEEMLQPAKIMLRAERIKKILGFIIPNAEIEAILKRLGFTLENKPEGWQVTVPARRSDITLEVDLIEEIIRLHGYDKLPLHDPIAMLKTQPHLENKLQASRLRNALVDLGYHEAITYSFIDEKLQTLFDPEKQIEKLVNPITADMTVMRSNLWPGLVTTLLYNQNRQQLRVRLFEIGLRFFIEENALIQQRVLSGLVSGTAFPEQWGMPNRAVDFFDLKGDLQNLFKLTLMSDEFYFKPGKHPALHPGQTAEIVYRDAYVGIAGALHPAIAQALDVQGKVFLFELQMDQLEAACIPHFVEISKFPEIRRDVAVLINEAVPAQAIQDTIKEAAGELLKSLHLFDLYQGKGIPVGQKSVAVGLTLQHSSRTLVDEEVADVVERVIVALKKRFTAELRG